MFTYGLLIGFLLNNLFVVFYMTLAVKEDRIARRIRKQYDISYPTATTEGDNK